MCGAGQPVGKPLAGQECAGQAAKPLDVRARVAHQVFVAGLNGLASSRGAGAPAPGGLGPLARVVGACCDHRG